MQATHQTFVTGKPQAAIDETAPGLDAGLKSLRIDRSDKKSRPPVRRKWPWLLVAFVLLVAATGGWMIFDRRNAATEVETIRLRPASANASSAGTGPSILN